MSMPFSGYKTYTAAIVMAAWAIYGMVTGDINPELGVQRLIEALAITGFRGALAK